jgi:glycosyltransferase involved in cell wall biosynthesis
MKIMLVITRSELGGAQSVVVQLANALCHEHDVVLVAGEGDGKMWELVDSRVKRIDCPHLQKSLSLKSDLLAAIALRRIYRKHRPDVVHLHSSKAGALGRIVFPSKRVVYTVHGFDSIRLAFRKFLPVERVLQRYAMAIVGVSNYDSKNMVTERITRNISTIYNGLTTPNTENITDFEVFNKYSKVVLTIARINPQKNPALFVEIARLMPEYGFVWIGNQHEVTEFGELPVNCHFLGNILNAGAYCSKADLFMLPSNYEGLPMVIIEAMSFGKPVVASDVGGISEIVRNDTNGYVVENSAEAFATRIREILQNREKYEAFSRASLDIYNAELTVDKMVAGYLNIYQSLL